MLLLLLGLSSLPVFVSGYAKYQCLCSNYEPCLKKTEVSFPECFRNCESSVPDVPSQYVTCLRELVDSMNKVHECSKGSVFSGCTANKYNVAKVRKFSDFLKAGAERINALGKRINLTEEKEHFTQCFVKCFFLPENNCTQTLDCALAMPDEHQMLNNIRECVLDSDPRLFLSLIACMGADKKKHPGSDFARSRRRF